MNMRPAEIGDEGVLLGQENHGGIATLILQISMNELAYLYGDRRMVAGLVEAFKGERVEVVEAEGSVYGAHGIRPPGEFLMHLGHGPYFPDKQPFPIPTSYDEPAT